MRICAAGQRLLLALQTDGRGLRRVGRERRRWAQAISAGWMPYAWAAVRMKRSLIFKRWREMGGRVVVRWRDDGVSPGRRRTRSGQATKGDHVTAKPLDPH